MKIATIVVSVLAALLLGAAPSAHAETKCDMQFHLAGWSAFYKVARGGGVITCDNGQSAHVVIRTKGGGITFGASRIGDGHGNFSPVSDISELFGDYANAEAHAGAGESSDAQAVTKGSVSLALSGTGHGINLGFAFGKFTIAHAAKPRPPVVEHHLDEHHLDEAPLDDRPRAVESPPREGY